MADILEHVLLLAIALGANFLSSLAGGGAGLLQLPALIFLGLPFTVALATHKIATVALGIGATLKHAKQGNINVLFASVLLGAGLPGVILGATLVIHIPEHIAKTALGILTIALGAYSIFKKQLGQTQHQRNRHLNGMAIGAIVIFILGMLNGSLTSGSGLFVTLWLITWFGFDFKRASAYTLIIVGLFWNGFGAVTLALQSPVQWDWLPTLVIGSLIGGYCGAHAAVTYGNHLIKRLFEILTLIVGITLIIN